MTEPESLDIAQRFAALEQQIADLRRRMVALEEREDSTYRGLTAIQKMAGNIAHRVDELENQQHDD